MIHPGVDEPALEAASAPEAEAHEADPFAEGGACLNCGVPLNGLYCAACGQRRAYRLTFHHILADAFQSIARVDSKFARTVVGMTLRPGRSVRDYIDGRRQAYLNPIKYILVTTTIFLVLINVFDLEVWRLSARTPQEREGFMLVFGLLAYLIFVNVLGSSLVQWIAFRKRKHTFAECYVFGLFCYGHLVLFFAIAAFLGAYNNITNYTSVIAGTILFLAWALVGFYRTRIWWALPAAFAMVIAYYTMGALMVALVRFVSYFFG